jgi:hypothetical protein
VPGVASVSRPDVAARWTCMLALCVAWPAGLECGLSAVLARPVSQRNLVRMPLIAAAVSCLAASVWDRSSAVPAAAAAQGQKIRRIFGPEGGIP